jgi:hypothetical protein
MPLFEECRERIDRAHAHFKAFASGWKILLKSESYTFSAEMKDGRTGVVHATLTNPIRHELALELGEFFYQLRATLDGAIFRGVELSRGTEEITKIDRLEFPIYLSEVSFDNAALNKNPFPEELRSWLKQIQPNDTAEHRDERDRAIAGLLKVLHDCARKDRHRKLHLVAAVPQNVSGSIQVPLPAKIVDVRRSISNLLYEKCEIVVFGIENAFPEMEIELKGTFTVEVSVDEIYGASGQKVIDILIAIEGVVRHIIDRFEHSFVNGPSHLAPSQLP